MSRVTLSRHAFRFTSFNGSNYRIRYDKRGTSSQAHLRLWMALASGIQSSQNRKPGKLL